MATQYLLGEDGARLPQGIVLAHTVYGEPDTNVTNAHSAPVGGVGVIPVGDDGIEYMGDRVVRLAPVSEAETPEEPEPEPDLPEEPFVTAAVSESPNRAKRCAAKDDTCMGWRIKGSEFCAAHAGVFRRSKDTA